MYLSLISINLNWLNNNQKWTDSNQNSKNQK